MAFSLIPGQRTWSVDRDDEGHRTYTIVHRVMTNDPLDGPALALQTPGLPLPGSFWAFDNDVDVFATCRLNARVTPVVTNEPNRHFDVQQTFTTRSTNRCSEAQVEDPLMEPQRVSGGFIKFMEEGLEDRFGRAIQYSSHEPIRGPQNEWEASRPSVHIDQNVAVLDIETFGPMVDTLNDAPLWGLPARCIKLSNAPWSKNYKGLCEVYYTRSFDFEVRVRKDEDGNLFSGWDRDVLDEGTKVLHGRWHATEDRWVLISIAGAPPDPTNPKHFDTFQDRNGNPARVVLNGAGLPGGVTVEGTEETLKATTAFATGTQEYTPTAQPDAPARLIFRVTDDNNQIEFAQVVVHGTGTSDEVISENIWVEAQETMDYRTTQTYKTVTKVVTLCSDVGTGASWELLTDITVTAAGKIHIEKHAESNFLLLGIPLVL